MAQNKIDECMFCERIPCQCGKQSKPTAKRTQRPASVRPPRSPKQGSNSGDHGTVSAARFEDGPDAEPPVQIEPQVRVRIPGPAQSSFVQQAKQNVKFTSARTDEDAEFRRAMTVLAEAELLAEEVLIEYRGLFNLPSWKIDALAWKAQGHAILYARQRRAAGQVEQDDGQVRSSR